MFQNGLMAVIGNLPGIKIKKIDEAGGQAKGTMAGENGAPVKFWISWNEDCLYLQLRRECPKLLEAVISDNGKPHLRWLLRGWFSSRIFYAWENSPAKRESLYASLTLGCALRNSRFGHQDIKLLTQ